MPLHLDVIVDVDAGCLPFSELATNSRQRLQRWLVLVARTEWRDCPRVCGSVCQLSCTNNSAMALVDFTEREELALPQRRHDPALDYLNPTSALALSPASDRGQCRNNRHAIVLSRRSRYVGFKLHFAITGMSDGRLPCYPALPPSATPPKNSQARVCEPIQFLRSCPEVASAKV